MTVFTNSFEQVPTGSAPSTSNSGGGTDTAFGVVSFSGNGTVGTAQVAHGTKALAITASSGSPAYVAFTGMNTANAAARVYAYLPSAPTGTGQLIQLKTSTGALVAALGFNSSGQVQIYNAAGGVIATLATPMTAYYGQWLRFELAASVTAGGNGAVVAAFYAGESTTAIDSFITFSTSTGTANVTRIDLGKLYGTAYAAAGTVYVDSVAVDNATSNLIGPLVRSAASTLSATCSLTVGAVVAQPATAVLTAAEDVTAAAEVAAVSAVALAAAETLSVAAAVSRLAAVTLVAVETLSAAGVVTRSAAVALTGTETLSTAAAATTSGAVTLTAAETLTVAAVVGPVAAVTLTASETLTAAGLQTRMATVALTGSCVLTVGSFATKTAAVALTVTSSLSVTAVATARAAVALAAMATLSVAGTISRVGSAALAATSTLTVAALNTVRATVVLTAVETLSVSGYATTFASVALTATSSLTTVAVRIQYAAPSLLVMASTLTLASASVETIDVRAPRYELRAIRPDGTQAGLLPNFSDLKVSLDLSDVGSATMQYPRGESGAELLADQTEIAVFADGVEIPDCRWIIEGTDGNVLADSTDPLATGVLRSYSGRNLWQLFDQAVVYPQSWPTIIAGDSNHNFASATAGTILGTLFQRAQTRGLLAGLSWAFTDTVDSDGNPWTLQLTIAFDAGVSYLAIIQNLVDQGVIDVQLLGRTVRVTNAGGVSVDRTLGSKPLILRAGRDIIDAPTKTDSRGLRTVALIKGDDGVFEEIVDPLATAAGGPGRRETFISQGGVKDSGTLIALGQATLDRVKQVRTEVTHGLALYPDGALPLRDYMPGDYVYSNVDGTNVRYRARQLAVTIGPSGMSQGTIVLNDKFFELEVALARRVTGITGGATAGGGSGAVPVDSTVDNEPPAQPGALSVDSTAYLDPDLAATLAQATITWPPVTTNADGTAIHDLDGYDVEYQTAQAIELTTPAEVTPASYDPVWTKRFARSQKPRGWIGGDGGVSIVLADGRDLWLWSDSFIGTVNPDGSQDVSSGNAPVFVRNALTTNTENFGGFATRVAGASGAETSYIPAPAARPANWYWPLSGVAVTGPGAGTVAVWCAEFTANPAIPAPFNVQYTGRTAIVTLDGASLAILAVDEIVTTDTVSWGQCHAEDDAWTYVYGLLDGGSTKNSYLYRVTKGLPNSSRQYWTGTAWSTTRTAAASILAHEIQAVRLIGGRYVGLFIDSLAQGLGWATAPAPQGPWTVQASGAYTMPEPQGGSGFAYFPRIHWQHSAGSGVLMSYSVNVPNSADITAQADNYQPRFLRGPGVLGPPDTDGEGWASAGHVSNPVAYASSLPAGGAFTVRVRATDSNGNRSPWTTATVTLGSDVTPPPVPSQPQVSELAGGLKIVWDGLGSLGEEMPADFWNTQVHVSKVDGFTPSAETQVDAFIGRYGGGSGYLTRLDYGDTYFVRLVAVDYAGNASAPSAQSSGVIPQLLGKDIANGIVDALKLADGAVTTPKIYPEAVTTAHLVVGAFGDNQVPNGNFEDGDLLGFDTAVQWSQGFSSGTAPTFGRSHTEQASGSACLKLHVARGQDVCRAWSAVIPVSPGEVWALSTKFKGSRATSTYGFTVNAYLGAANPPDPFAAGGTVGLLIAGLPAAYPTSTYDANLTIPAGMKYMRIDVEAGNIPGDVNPLDVFVDLVLGRKVIGTAQIADLAVANAKIAYLAVDDAKITSLTAGKISAGTLSAVVTISGRIATATTGQRVEINGAGLQAYGGPGSNPPLVTEVRTDGGLVSQWFRTAGTGRRIEMGTLSIAGDNATIVFPGSTTLLGLPPAVFLSTVGTSDGSDALSLSSGQRTNTAAQSVILLSGTDGIVLRGGVKLDGSRVAQSITLDPGPGGTIILSDTVAGGAGARFSNVSGQSFVAIYNGALYLRDELNTTSRVQYSSLRDGPGIYGYGGISFFTESGGESERMYLTTSGAGLRGDLDVQGVIGSFFNGSTGYAPSLSSSDGNHSVSLDYQGGNIRFLVDGGLQSKTFIINHPLEADRWLVHATLEGPESGVYYRGQGRTDYEGNAVCDLPAYAAALCDPGKWSVHLTAIDVPDALAASRIRDGQFRVTGPSFVDFWWVAYGVRADIVPLFVEPHRDEITVSGDGPYRYYDLKEDSRVGAS